MRRYRWVVLAAGTASQASYSAIPPGLAVLAPAIRHRYGLGLGEVGTVLASASIGSLLSLLGWGVLADRLGERWVIGVGLTGAGAALVGAAFVDRFASLVALLAAAGFLGAAVNSASGRAVMHWFAPQQRGFALGIRQTAIPIGGAAAALVLPHVSLRTGLVILGAGCVLGAAVAGGLLREGARASGEETGTKPLRDRRVWRLSGASALIVAPQTCIVGFMVVFLHERRAMTAGAAAAVLAVVQLLAIAGRIGAGRWSDAVGSRMKPLRLIALTSASLAAIATVLVGAPLLALLPVLVLAGVAAMSWNGLSFAAAAELAGSARSGVAIGIQQTTLSLAGAAMPPAFGALVGGSSWEVGFAVVALFPLLGWRVLAPLRG